VLFFEGSPKQSAKKGKSKGDRSKSRSKSPKSQKSSENTPNKKRSGKKSSSPKDKPDASALIPAEIKETPPEENIPQPGSIDYTYVNEKLDMKIAKIICDQWELVEITYTNGIKFIFRKIRKEREQIIRYLFQIKRNFLDYLKRPDTKQIELEFFIKEYNKIPTDLRDDEEMKAELHQRVEDLRDNLYKVCDIKKEESEKERETIMNNGWLPDKIGFLINNYITLMQVSIINLYFLKLFTSSIFEYIIK
jgi:hypothetical protein